jgi:hypothetical protein
MDYTGETSFITFDSVLEKVWIIVYLVVKLTIGPWQQLTEITAFSACVSTV